MAAMTAPARELCAGSADASDRLQGAMVARQTLGKGARPSSLPDGEARGDPHLDRRRSCLSQAGKTLRRMMRQHCGQSGRQDNSQVAVTSLITDDRASLPVAYRPYLLAILADDAHRPGKAWFC
jgi:hypothetical protein